MAHELLIPEAKNAIWFDSFSLQKCNLRVFKAFEQQCVVMMIMIITINFCMKLVKETTFELYML